MDYCCIIWGKGNTNYINNVCKLQKRIAKIILQQPQRSPSINLFETLNWLPFLDRCKYHTAVLVFKTLNNMAPTYMTELMTLSDNKIYNLRSRSRKDIVLWTRPKTNYIKDTFSYYGMNIWNNIPLNIRNANNLKCFKEKYKAYLDVHMSE
jgi:hypothetical protein